MWTLAGIQDAVIVEFGPSGNTSFEYEGFFHLNMGPAARIFSTHMRESDITFGSADRLVDAIEEIDGLYKPEVIFILASSLAGVTGIDTEGICREIEGDTGAALKVADSGGFRGDYSFGIRKTLKFLCSDIVKATAGKASDVTTYNILGSQADCYNFRSDLYEIRRLLKKYFNLGCGAVFTSATSLHDIQHAGGASFNVVMRSEALDAARIMKANFQQDFVSGMAYGQQATLEFLESVSDITGIRIDKDELASEIQACEEARAMVMALDEQSPSGNAVLVSGTGMR